jgi:hypothetical protein
MQMCMGRVRNEYNTLGKKNDKKRPLGRSRKGNIKMDFNEVGFYTVDWIHLAWFRD